METRKYTVREAMKGFSRLVREAEAGDDVYIMRAGKPIVKVEPIELKQRALGRFEGKISWTPDAFDPLTDEEMKELGFE